MLLRAEGLRKAFGGQVVLEGLTLELRQGEVALLRGENGSGKTTLLNILTGNLEPDSGNIHYLADGTPRTYRFPRPWWREINPFDHFTPECVAREGVGRTWQDIRLFGSQTLRDNIVVAAPDHPGENPALALINVGQGSRRETALNRAADAMLARLGLTGREDSSADKISLGQSKRVAIARAVAAGARILFLDEPLAGLDRQGIDDVLELLEDLVREQQITLVIIEHTFNQPHLHGLVTTDWMLQGGIIRRQDSQRRAEQFARVPTRVATTMIPHPPWLDLLVDDADELVDEQLPRGALLTRIRCPASSSRSRTPQLQAQGLLVSLGSRMVVGLDDQGNASGFDLKVFENEIAILQAPNGWGKTTLFRALAGLTELTHGHIFLQARDITESHPWQRARFGMQFVLSNACAFQGLLVKEQLALARHEEPFDTLETLAERMFSSLSGGEQRKVTLEASLHSARSPVIDILDEPFNAFDYNATREAVALIKSTSASAKLLLVPSSG